MNIFYTKKLKIFLLIMITIFNIFIVGVLSVASSDLDWIEPVQETGTLENVLQNQQIMLLNRKIECAYKAASTVRIQGSMLKNNTNNPREWDRLSQQFEEMKTMESNYDLKLNELKILVLDKLGHLPLWWQENMGDKYQAGLKKLRELVWEK